MVQLPATAAKEYVAACWVPGAGGIFVGGTRTRTKTKNRTKTKTVWGAYARSPQFQCAYAPSRLSVPSIVAWRTKKQTNIQTNKKRQTRPHSSAGSRPPLPKFSGYVQGGPKKVSLRCLHITSSNTGRFSKFFHCHILQEICSKVVVKYSTSPQSCRYTTLWNIYVRKLVNQWNLSHHFVSQNWNTTNICNIPDQCCW